MTQLLDPETKQSPAKEIARRGKGCLAVFVSLAILACGVYLVWDRASGFLEGIGDTPDYPGPGGAVVTVTIPDGATLSDMGAILLRSKIVLSTDAWDDAVGDEPDAMTIQPGSYRLRTQVPAKDALDTLLDPTTSRIRRQVTVPEGLRLSAQLPVLAKGTKIKQARFQAALKKPAGIGLPPYAKGDAEGYLFPNTYELTAESDATSVLQQMTAQFAATSQQLGLDAKAKSLGVSTAQLVTVASIIEKEVRRPADRAKVARVLYNRLAQNKKLELNSTLVYALGYSSEGSITNADLKKNIPYNTYVRPGLPPTPISSPGAAALKAAAEPAAGDWIWFVTVNCDSGATNFTASEAEHERNVTTFQRWRDAHPGRC